LDGFDAMDDVKVIMATNRIETLDPAFFRIFDNVLRHQSRALPVFQPFFYQQYLRW